jgi:hypothetical protein
VSGQRHRIAAAVFGIASGVLACAFAAHGDAPKCVNCQTPPEALKQCSDCHMIFPAKMLPQRSWKAIIAGLDNHFGESADMSEADKAEILSYLTSHAADGPYATPRDRHYLSEILPDATPLRITRTAWWNQVHADFNFDGVKRSKVKSPANCLACHVNGVN